MLLCRPSLSVMKHTYRFIDRHMYHCHRLWRSVKRELILVMAIAPLLRVELWRPLESNIVASDASSMAAGVVTAFASESLVNTLWGQNSTRSSSLLSLTAERTALPPATSLHILQPAIHYGTNLSAPLDLLALMPTVSWSTVISSPWHRQLTSMNWNCIQCCWPSDGRCHNLSSAALVFVYLRTRLLSIMVCRKAGLVLLLSCPCLDAMLL